MRRRSTPSAASFGTEALLALGEASSVDLTSAFCFSDLNGSFSAFQNFATLALPMRRPLPAFPAIAAAFDPDAYGV